MIPKTPRLQKLLAESVPRCHSYRTFLDGQQFRELTSKLKHCMGSHFGNTMPYHPSSPPGFVGKSVHMCFFLMFFCQKVRFTINHKLFPFGP